MMKYCFLVLAFWSSTVSAQQGPVIEFTETEYDFGNVQEEGGPITHSFEFVNKGNAPLVISNVKASCGCTTPGWSKDPILPGEKGYVQAQYNPANRPGSFRKSLTVTSNSSTSNSSFLYIKGNVDPKPRTPADDYPTKLGNTRFKYRSLNFGIVTTEKPITRTFEVYNDSNSPITFQSKVEAPAHLKVTVEPVTLEAKSVGAVKVEYDPRPKEGWGTILTTSNSSPTKQLTTKRPCTYWPPSKSISRP